MFLFFALFLCLFFYKVRILKAEPQNNFSKENTLALKGICAILVMFHHLGLFTFYYTGTLGNFNTYLGGISVAIFFMISAYGLTLQFKKYGVKYLKRLLFVKVPKLYLFFVGTNVVYYFALNKITDFPGGGLNLR